MSGLATSRTMVHRPVQPQNLPLVQRSGRHWCLLDRGTPQTPPQTAELTGPSTDSLLDLLSDLAYYGLVLPLAEVRPGALLWWLDQPAPEDELRVPVSLDGMFHPPLTANANASAVAHAAPSVGINGASTPSSPTLRPRRAPQQRPDAIATQRDKQCGLVTMQEPLSRIRWTVASPASDRWRYGVSSMARWLVASTRLPMVHHELISLVATVNALPKGDVYLSLSLPNPTPFAWIWHPHCWGAVQRRALLLRERRRLALGLSAQHDATQLDELIQHRFLVPTVQTLLNAVNPDAQRRLHILAPRQFDQIDTSVDLIELPVGHYLSDDPLGDNLYVLGSRRIQPATTLARQLRSTGRGLVTLAHNTQQLALAQRTDTHPEWGSAMLAALQLDYLQTHRGPPGFFGVPT